MQAQANHISINNGVDFERARELLNGIAGRAFSQYLKAKKADLTTSEQLAELRSAYKEALEDFDSLKPSDVEEIRSVLAVHK